MTARKFACYGESDTVYTQVDISEEALLRVGVLRHPSEVADEF